MTVAENVELPAILSGAHGPERPAAGRTVAELLDLSKQAASKRYVQALQRLKAILSEAPEFRDT